MGGSSSAYDIIPMFLRLPVIIMQAVGEQRRQVLALPIRIGLPILILAAAIYLRAASQRTFAALFDEDITRAIASEIWKGNLRNNWKYVPEISSAWRFDSYNFSSYMYAD